MAWVSSSRIAAVFIALSAVEASAQDASSPKASGGVSVLPTIDVIATTPLSGSGVDVDKVPAAVTIIDSQEIEREKSPNIVKSLSQQTPSVDVQEVAGNPFQPDVLFRGFDASPVSGTPQGLAVYQNGVRINEAFGDNVNWDFIPTVAVRSMDVISNNPAFGLNALGGAISVQMKDGFTFQGTSIDVMGGSYGRIQSSLQWGKQVGPWATYVAVEGAHDDGYRQFGSSNVRRFYGDIGYKTDSGEFHINVGAADDSFGAAATSPIELLNQNWSNVYTTPQTSTNQVAYVNATADVRVTPTWSLQANAHVRSFYQSTQDGNPTDAQPCDPSQGGATGSSASTIRSLPPTGLMDNSSSIRFRPARPSARSTTHTRRRPAPARLCRGPTPTSCSATTIISSSARASTTASPISARARSSEPSNPITSSPATASISDPRATRSPTARSRCARPTPIRASTRSTPST